MSDELTEITMNLARVTLEMAGREIDRLRAEKKVLNGTIAIQRQLIASMKEVVKAADRFVAADFNDDVELDASELALRASLDVYEAWMTGEANE